jgi:hypothetical protein
MLPGLLAAVGWVSLLLSLGSFTAFVWLTLRGRQLKVTGATPAPVAAQSVTAPAAPGPEPSYDKAQALEPAPSAASSPSSPPPIPASAVPGDLVQLVEALCALVAAMVFLGFAVLCGSLVR